MKLQNSGNFFFFTVAFLSASVDPPFKEPTDDGIIKNKTSPIQLAQTGERTGGPIPISEEIY